MKKYIGFIILAGLMLSPVAFAKDSDDDISPLPPVYNKENKEAWKEKKETMKKEREAFREKMKTERKAFVDNLKVKRDAFKEELKAKKEEFKALNSEKKKDFWEKSKKMIGERFESAVTNLVKIQDKVGSIITKLDGAGRDTTEAKEALSLSKSKLEEAKVKIAEIKSLLPATTGETITAEVFEKVKVLAREARDLLKESREYLHDSIEAIKMIKDEDKDEDESEDESGDDSSN